MSHLQFLARLSVTFLAILLIACPVPQRQQETVTPQASVKNIILMVGDGMGFNHVAAASLYTYGRPSGQPYQAFPVRLAMSTYPAGGRYDSQGFWANYPSAGEGATDSAAAATAMATGSKTDRYAIGVNSLRRKLPNVVERAEASGRSTGVITSVQISHATPAAFVAHHPMRRNLEEIAREMILDSGLEVLMGSGHPWYDHDGKMRSQPDSFRSIGGKSTWNALQKGTPAQDCDGDGSPDVWTLIEDRQAFRNLAEGETPKRVLGLARVSRTLQQGRGNPAQMQAPVAVPFTDPFIETVPTLAEMTRAALNVLDGDEEGFFLMIEGGAIDWASHANQSERMIEELVGFDQAVAAAIDWIESHGGWDETLLVVTADHETGFLNGPGPRTRPNPLVGRGVAKVPDLQWQSGTHTNALVPLFAKGAGSESFRRYLLPAPDPVRGPYLDNTAVGQLILSLFEPAIPFSQRRLDLRQSVSSPQVTQ